MDPLVLSAEKKALGIEERLQARLKPTEEVNGKAPEIAGNEASSRKENKESEA